ncbi:MULTISPECIES: radical SAM/SPASM domain-containing protein [unclassified Agarivorans]|uniref:radical SAM/SPASM domain-containing protein n=1 Tax=unclassified Agarivorans TaxID=2636026 RepID=UPI0026E115DA|nr:MULTISPECIES: radical SAM/SPASM domain-containing protein [unclassified Agarivorans]MDO6684605.1 SPASM domain-containing protein [Agarivorans sp. 3_MG-2023]MDO6714770.1 SPASM domain-containing protein [Agarivorans sp. 2_MG-2023]
MSLNLPFRTITERKSPIEIQVQTTSVCNANCIMCPYPTTSSNITQGRITEELYKKIVDDCAVNEVRIFKPFLMNEPLLDSRIPRFIAYSREKLPNAEISISTNGSHLKLEMAEKLAQCGIDEVWVNMPSVDSRRYNEITGLKHEDTINNILNFQHLLTLSKSPTKLIISIVELSKKPNATKSAKEYWENIGIHPIVTPFNNRGGHVSLENDVKINPHNQKRICDRPFYKLYILFNGDVILCSSDWNRKHIIGNVGISSINEIWHSTDANKYREAMKEHNYNIAEICEQCSYNHLHA